MMDAVSLRLLSNILPRLFTGLNGEAELVHSLPPFQHQVSRLCWLEVQVKNFRIHLLHVILKCHFFCKVNSLKELHNSSLIRMILQGYHELCLISRKELLEINKNVAAMEPVVNFDLHQKSIFVVD
jgi:hypothetical protein